MKIGRQFDLPENIRKVLMVQLGDIGDVVWSLPTFRAVKDALPQAQLYLLVREGIASLFAADPAVAGVFEVKRYSGSLTNRLREEFAFLLRVRKAGFDLVFDLRADERGAFMARLTGAPYRASLVAADSPFYRNRLFTHLVYPANENVRIRLGATEQTLRIVRCFGVPTGDTVPKLRIAASALDRMKTLLDARGIRFPEDGAAGGRGDFVTLSPFSRWAYKEWPRENWEAIGSWLDQECGITAVIVGSAAERGRAEGLVGKSSVKMLNMAGETTLGELAALLSMSRLHVGVDSAAPHIAAAVGTPTITIYGPSDWRDWAPVGEGHQVVTADMSCSPCHKKGCDGQGRSRCLESIAPGSVQEAIMKVVSPRR